MPNDQNQGTTPTSSAVDVVNQYTGEKWYYSDIVKDHFFHPRNLLLEDPVAGQYNATGKVGSPACLLPDTNVITNPDVKTIQNVSRGERVFSHDSRYHAVERIFRVTYPKTLLVRLKNYLGTVTLTEDHLVYGKRIPAGNGFHRHRYRKGIPSAWHHAGELSVGDISSYPIPTEVRAVKPLQFSSVRGRWDFKSRAIPATVPITKELLELFGYFLAEGYTKSTQFGFIFSNRERHLADRVALLTKDIFGLESSIRERPENHRIDVDVYNVHLAHAFRRMFGDSAVRKNIPEEFLFADPELQRGLLKGIWLGDGYFSRVRRQPRAGYATVSQKLFSQIVFLLLRQHIIPSTFREQAKKVRGVHHQAAYRIHVGDMASLEKLAGILGLSFLRDPSKRHEVRAWFEENILYLPVKGIERVPFVGGKLMNFEVAGSHTYATDAFLVHNCGDMMFMWLAIDPATERVKEMKWRTFGCASAIAATSMFSVMITEHEGMTVADALKVRPQDIMMRLGGLPNRKIHCSVLADKAFRKAANDYFHESGQHERVIVEGAKVIDPKLNITDHDIEEAVLEGAMDLDAVQQKLKVGIGSPEIITDVEQLIRFYKEKYYG